MNQWSPNAALSIPCENFVGLEQIVLAAKRNQEYDNERHPLAVTPVLGGEFSLQMNSRNFKANIGPLFLNTVLTCRHYYMSLYYTAQRSGHVDALLRQNTQDASMEGIVRTSRRWLRGSLSWHHREKPQKRGSKLC